MKLSEHVTIPRKVQPSNTFVPIPFKRFEYGDLDKSEYETYTLKNQPDDPNSSTFRVNVPYYRGGRGEECILFRRNLEKVFVGQNVVTDAVKFSITRRLLQGAALATFNSKVDVYEDENDEVFTLGLIAVRNAAFPKRAISKQKRYMRRHMHKGVGTPFKTFLHRVQEMNGYFKEMPPNIPAEEGEVEVAPEGMPEDDIMDILEFACPTEWQKQMRLQDFDTSQRTPEELLDFCENLEELEELEQQKHTKKAGKESKAKTNKKRGSEKEKGTYHCMLHGVNSSHNTDECTVLKSQAKKMRGMCNAQPNDRKAKYKQQQELQAIVASSIAHAMKDLKKKKRKRSAESTKSRKKSSEVNAFENMSLSDDSEKVSESSENDSTSDSSETGTTSTEES